MECGSLSNAYSNETCDVGNQTLPQCNDTCRGFQVTMSPRHTKRSSSDSTDHDLLVHSLLYCLAPTPADRISPVHTRSKGAVGPPIDCLGVVFNAKRICTLAFQNHRDNVWGVEITPITAYSSLHTCAPPSADTAVLVAKRDFLALRMQQRFTSQLSSVGSVSFAYISGLTCRGCMPGIAPNQDHGAHQVMSCGKRYTATQGRPLLYVVPMRWLKRSCNYQMACIHAAWAGHLERCDLKSGACTSCHHDIMTRGPSGVPSQ